MSNLNYTLSAVLLFSAGAFCQNSTPDAPAEPSRTVPLYKVTVVEHSLQAVNYQYRSIPTEIDFRGTVLLPTAKGHATIESKRGRTDIEAKFEKLTPPTPFGRQYLTYVLWAISPEGAPHNLGEVVPGGSGTARVHVTTDLQAFGLLITAEPYSAVRQPSDVVVMENQVRPDTVGRIEPIVAKAELLSRGQFTYDKQAALSNQAENAPKVSMDEYEQLSEIYQAENALGIARAAHADQLAPNTFAKAQAAYDEAQRLKSAKAGVSQVVQLAREAAQTADDARMIATRRSQEDRVANAEQQIAQAQQAAAQAQAEAQRARAEADAARAQAANERTARQRAEAEAAEAPSVRSQDLPIAPPPPPEPAPAPRSNTGPSRPERSSSTIAHAYAGIFERHRRNPRHAARYRDTLGDTGFEGGTVRLSTSQTLSRLAQILTAPGLAVSVEGYSDTSSGAGIASQRAEAVRDMLIRGGIRPGVITAHSMADARPLTSNATAAGRAENRRVEIVISGGPVGSHPLWDRPYSVTLR